MEELLKYIKEYLSAGLIAKIIETRKPVDSTLARLAFPNAEQRATALINIRELMDQTNTAPVIKRGGQAVPINPANGSTLSIEPLSIRVSDLLTAAQLNNLKVIYGEGGESGEALVNIELDRIIMRLMETIDRTRYALASQALTGKIDYMMDSNGGKERYEIEFGTPNKIANQNLKAEGTTVTKVYEILEDMQEKISEAGYTGEVVVFAGKDAYRAILSLVTATSESKRLGATVEKDGININGYKIIPIRTSYNDKNVSGKAQVKDNIDKASLCMCVPSYNTMIYAAIDDVDAGLQALPFFSKTVKLDDPSAIKVIGDSKPLPFAPAASICWAKVC